MRLYWKICRLHIVSLTAFLTTASGLKINAIASARLLLPLIILLFPPQGLRWLLLCGEVRQTELSSTSLPPTFL
jgi:hypothetical protein